MLILGQAGTGKTTLLVELARDLAARAEESAEEPVPVVLNLASWSLGRPPLAKWLINELASGKYGVKRHEGEVLLVH